MWETAVVVGASSGIGEAMSRQLAGQGIRVAMVARRTDRLEKIATELNAGLAQPVALAMTGDVVDSAQSQDLFRDVVAKLGRVDLVVYSAGIMPRDTARAYPTDEDISAIETNFAGAVTWLNEAARYFESHGAGTIIGIGSIAGERGRQGSPVYNATKSALATYLESLSARLKRKGITVLIAKPGPVRTAMLGDRKVFPPAPSAERAARDILTAARRGRRVVYIPWWMRLVSIGLHIVPAQVMERISV